MTGPKSNKKRGESRERPLALDQFRPSPHPRRLRRNEVYIPYPVRPWTSSTLCAVIVHPLDGREAQAHDRVRAGVSWRPPIPPASFCPGRIRIVAGREYIREDSPIHALILPNSEPAFDAQEAIACYRHTHPLKTRARAIISPVARTITSTTTRRPQTPQPRLNTLAIITPMGARPEPGPPD